MHKSLKNELISAKSTSHDVQQYVRNEFYFTDAIYVEMHIPSIRCKRKKT